jgi:RND family efflux transporter MFP subunit
MRLSFAAPLALSAALFTAGCDRKGQEAAAPPPPRVVLVATVHAAPDALERSLPGTIRARVESDLGFRVGGKVVRRLVDAGTYVVPGQPLAELDQVDLELQLQQARAELAAATTARDMTQNELKRIATLHGGGWSTGSDLDRQNAAAEEAVNRLDRATRAVTLAERARDYSTLRADVDGVVTATMCDPGQVMAVGQTAFHLARLDEREAAVAVPESMVDEIRRGTPHIAIWALPGRSFAAKLRELTPNADPATRTYAARFSLPDAGLDVMLGMTATVTITREAHDVVHVPLSALLDEGNSPNVWVINAAKGTVEKRPVTVARYGGDAVISAGLRDGEQIVTLGAQKLQDAERVRPITRLPS